MFYAQSTMAVISGQSVRKSVCMTLDMKKSKCIIRFKEVEVYN